MENKMRWFIYSLLAAVAGSAAVCDRPEVQAEGSRAGVVDSVLTRDEVLRRFREGLAPVGELENGQKNRDQLVAAFVAALGSSDTMALRSMAITRAEFAFLYYPTTPQGRPPYDLEPGLMWHLLVQRSDRGLRRALRAYGGRRFRLVRYNCGKEQSREGDNTISGPCVIRVRDPEGSIVSLGLISQIIERDGRYKFISYANKL